MQRLTYLFLYLCAISLGSCKSSQMNPTLPVVREYGLQYHATSKAKQPDATLPELTAALSDEGTSEEKIAVIPPRRMVELPVIRIASAADTTRKRATVALDSALLLRPDPKTNTVNIIGGLIGAVGAGLMVASVTDDSPIYNLSDDYKRFIKAQAGVLLLLTGAVLLLYQGKNGRGRLRREARRSAKYSQEEVGLKDVGQSKRQALKGMGMLLGGGALVLLTFSTSLALPIGLPALVIALTGLVALIASAS